MNTHEPTIFLIQPAYEPIPASEQPLAQWFRPTDFKPATFTSDVKPTWHDIEEARLILLESGLYRSIVVDENNELIIGIDLLREYDRLKMTVFPVFQLTHLSSLQKVAMEIGYNQRFGGQS
jgi:hypothetical protein